MRPMLGLALRDWYSRQLGLGWVPNNENKDHFKNPTTMTTRIYVAPITM